MNTVLSQVSHKPDTVLFYDIVRSRLWLLPLHGFSYYRKEGKNMKRRYLALVLGLALSAASVNVFAEETNETEAVTEAVTIEITDSDLEGEASEEAVLGQVVSIDESSITIELGTVTDSQAEELSAEGEEDTADSENGTEETEAEETEAEETDAADASVLSQADVQIELTGEESTLTITGNTEFYSTAEDSEEALGEAPLSEEPVSEENTEDSTSEEESTEAVQDLAAQENTSEKEEAVLETETIEISEIQEGDFVSIVLDEEGNAASITVVTQSEAEGGAEEEAAEDETSDLSADSTEAIEE